MLLFQIILIENSYSVYPPFKRDAPSEIKNWTLRDSAVVQKTKIRLIPTKGKELGGLCQLLETDFNDFLLEFDVKINNSDFLFTYSRNVCPKPFGFFEGFGFNISNRGTEEYSVSAIGSGVFGSQKASVTIPSDKAFVRFRVTKVGQTIGLVCFLERPVTLLNFSSFTIQDLGYLSVYSVCESKDCQSDLLAIRTYALSPVLNKTTQWLLDTNRKYIRNNYNSRSEEKSERRVKMMTIAKYLYSENDEFDLKDSFKEIKEMTRRAKEAISKPDLTTILVNDIIPSITNASERFLKVSDALWHMKSEMRTLWDSVKLELKKMNININNDLQRVKNQTIESFTAIGSHQPQKLGKLRGSHPLSSFLFWVSVIEMVGYVVFFIKQHNRISNRKYQ